MDRNAFKQMEITSLTLTHKVVTNFLNDDAGESDGK